MSELDPRAGQGFELADAVEALRRHLGWLLLGPLVGVALALLALRIAPASYRSEATLLIESRWFPQGFVQNPLGKPMRERLQTLQYRLTSDAALGAIAGEVGSGRFRAKSDARRDAELRTGLHFEIADAASPDAAVIRVAYVAADPELARDVVRAATGHAVEESRREGAQQAATTAAVLDEELASVGRELAEKSAQLARLGARSPVAPSAIDTGADQVRARRLDALQALEAEVAHAEARYTERNPILAELRAELESARASASGRGPGHAGGSVDSGAEYRALLPAYESSLKTYESLLGRRIDAAMAQRLGERGAVPEIRVLREASLPERPAAPDRRLFLAGGAAGGLAAAMLLALLPAWRRPTFAGVDALAEASGLPVVSAVPELATAHGPALVEPESAAGEQFRRILPHLSRASGTPVVLVTAAEGGAGTSWCALQLAAVAARDGQRRTLLIDADLRSPSLGALLGVPPGAGLVECVRGDHLLSGAVLPTPISNLFLLPAGRAEGGALAALEDERLPKLVEEARREFGAIFVDAPARLAVVDAALAERLATLLLLVVRADRTPRESVRRVLRGVGPPVGLILNRVRPSAYRRHFGESPTRPPHPTRSDPR